MKIRMITTFFGPHSFGGDAAYVERLSQALLRRGHEVHVHYCVDAFNAVRGDQKPREYQAPEGLEIHPLKSPFGVLSPILTQATGKPWLKTGGLREALDDPATDLFHFHNISLVGGPGVLELGSNHHAPRIMTAHEYWLFCPMHLLWKNGERACDAPQCLRCMLRDHKPPQLWRGTSAVPRGLSRLSTLLFPSAHALEEHRKRGLGRHVPLVHLPLFLPDGWAAAPRRSSEEPEARPYLAAAGRLVAMKGFQRVIPLMKYLPEADLRIAGGGPYENELRKLAEGLTNVHFEGLLPGHRLARLFRGARGVVVPSLFPEIFGYVVLEAFAAGTPVVVHEGGGALQETGIQSGGGLGYTSDVELLTAMRRLVHDDRLRAQLAARGRQTLETAWSEDTHLEAYMQIATQGRADRGLSTLAGPHAWRRAAQRRAVPD